VTSAAAGAKTNAASVTMDGGRCVLKGDWNVQAFAVKGEVGRLRKALSTAQAATAWDLSEIGLLDAVGAQLLWTHWKQKIPAGTQLTSGQQALFDILAEHPLEEVPPAPPRDWLAWVLAIGTGLFVIAEHGRKLLLLLGGFILDFAKLLRHPLRGPWRERSQHYCRTTELSRT
jgi:phospholipid/cholesterol/gamma-HCH transport system permease protein